MEFAPRPVEGVRSTALYILSNVGRFFRRPRPVRGQVLVVLEGKHDVEFFRRISGILHAETAEVPDLRTLEHRGQVVFLPCGGFDRHQWPLRLAPLGCREFHLFDRDLPQDADARCQAAAVVNLRPGCRAAVTRKRTLENYLHSQAIQEAGGVKVQFTDEDDVPDLVAQACYERSTPAMPWESLPARARRRYRNHVKRWLNTRAVDRMTSERLAERDPQGEVRSWLLAIAELALR